MITGTRFLNIEGMLPFENMIADYVKETGNHVLYRVTPVFQGSELLARGVQMEAISLEDDGEGICFYIYAYNSQPGIEIDYATGESRLIEASQPAEDSEESGSVTYILNTNTKKFHLEDCSQAENIKESNRLISHEDRQALVDKGYSPCKNCDP